MFNFYNGYNLDVKDQFFFQNLNQMYKFHLHQESSQPKLMAAIIKLILVFSCEMKYVCVKDCYIYCHFLQLRKCMKRSDYCNELWVKMAIGSIC